MSDVKDHTMDNKINIQQRKWYTILMQINITILINKFNINKLKY